MFANCIFYFVDAVCVDVLLLIINIYHPDVYTSAVCQIYCVMYF